MTSLEPLSADRRPALEAFFGRIPESDLNSFSEDVLAPGLVSSWLANPAHPRVLAVSPDGEVVGYLAVIPLVGWSAHVGSLRVVVDPSRRGQGIGRLLAREGLLTGLRLGLTKLVVEVVADAEAAIGMFESIGFEPEALLRDHVRDRAGHLRDLIVLAHSVDETWSGMETAGIEEALS